MPKRIDRKVQKLIVRAKAKKIARKFNRPTRGLRKNLAEQNLPLLNKWTAELKA